MKILILTQTFPLSPADHTAHFMLDFAQGFVSLGHQVTVLVPFHPKFNLESFKKILNSPNSAKRGISAEGTFSILNFRYIWPASLNLLGYGSSLQDNSTLKLSNYFLIPFYIFFGSVKSIQLIHRHKIQVINAHWILPSGLIGAITSKLTGVPLFVTLAGSDVYIARKNWLFKMISWAIIKRAKKIISNSPQLLKDLGVKGEVTSYAVPSNTDAKIQNTTLTIATAGRDMEKKGFKILKEVHPDIEIITDLPIDQFRQKLLSVDIFIAYSIRDSAGNLDDSSLVLLEAMSAGCAVICTDLLGYRTIINSRQNGLLVPMRDKKALSRAINSLRRNPRLRQKLGQNARETIRNHFTPEKTAQAYLDLFAKIQK